MAIGLMNGFAERTGLTSEEPARRYLWTDAFAVCNFLALEQKVGGGHYRELALRLVDQVHRELGRHRADDARRGWIAGVSEEEGTAHPTRGGLRIGKPLPERAADEPADAQREWDQDGQYFHYLTKWMHALDQMSRASGRAVFHLWARELAVTAHRAFTVGEAGRRRMVWKRSIDLSRALVSSMGHHDPLDGLVSCLELDATAKALGVAPEPDLAAARADFSAMVDMDGLATDDPLGLGGLLADAGKLAQVGEGEKAAPLLVAAAAGLRAYGAGPHLGAPASRRLAFRELGLAIGLAGVPRLRSQLERLDDRGRAALSRLLPFEALAGEIESF
jgi:hypothetical protein